MNISAIKSCHATFSGLMKMLNGDTGGIFKLVYKLIILTELIEFSNHFIPHFPC